MASIKQLLWKTFNDLGQNELKTFLWCLKDTTPIQKSKIENADILVIVDAIVDCFGPDEAVKTMVKILRKMQQNNLAEQLENNHKQGNIL